MEATVIGRSIMWDCDDEDDDAVKSGIRRGFVVVGIVGIIVGLFIFFVRH